MSEKIYALLLRLYPSCFRKTYRSEALQLFRDRARDEKGFFRSLRLWLDLLADLAVSIARGYVHVEPDLHLDGIPSFCVLGDESPHRGALFTGGLLSLLTLAAIPISIHLSAQQLKPPGAPRATTLPAVERGKLDAAERQRVIHVAIANLKRYYIDPAGARKIADALLAHEKNGDYDAVTDGPAFAALLAGQLRDVSHDAHLDLIYSQSPLHEGPPGPTTEGLARYRKAMEQQNCTFDKVEILPHNIGYLKLNSFPDPSVCQPAAGTAMASLSHADAIIFDLRDNGGGYPGMVMMLAAYLFDHPEYLYNPRENTTRESWTQPVPGNRLADKPVYVLTSSRTASAAEHFSYNLKMLKRATLVGETTRGSAHSGVFHRIDDHFGMGIPETKPINPFSDHDWEGTGVKPDINVKAADALEAAKQLAESKSLK